MPAGGYQQAEAMQLPTQSSSQILATQDDDVSSRRSACHKRRHWRFLLILATITALLPLTTQASSFPEMGGVVIAVSDTNCAPMSWADTEKRNLGMDATAVKIMIEGQYCMLPQFAEDAIGKGADTVTYVTASDTSTLTKTEVESELNRTNIGNSDSFWTLVNRYSQILFVVEIGNEPDNAGWNLTTYKNTVNTIVQGLRTDGYTRANLKYVVSLPTPGACVPGNGTCTANISTVLDDGTLQQNFDGFATHYYADDNLTSGDTSFNRWQEANNYLLSNTTKPVVVTEFGICDPALNKETKGDRYAAFINSLDRTRIPAAFPFTISNYTKECPPNGPTDVHQQGYTIESSTVAYTGPGGGNEIDEAQHIAAWQQASTENGYTLKGKFRDWRDRDGGVYIMGYPISNQWINSVKRHAQWFERQLFYYNPVTGWDNPNWAMEYGLLGDMKAQHNDWMTQNAQGAYAPTGVNPAFNTRAYDPNNTSCDYFAQTGHWLCNGFKDRWHQYGRDFDGAQYQGQVTQAESIALWGYPVSEEFTQCDANGANCLTVQYFERAVFEYHPGNPSPWNIEYSLLGQEYHDGWPSTNTFH